MSNPKVLITAQIHPYLKEQFLLSGYEVDEVFDISQTELAEIIHQYKVLVITTYLTVDKTILDAATNLEIIARVGSGLENVDVVVCKEKNIVVVNSPEGNAQAVAEHSLALLLNLNNNVSKSNNELKNGIFLREANRGFELSEQKIGIIGFGNTGQAFAKLLQVFDTNIYFYDIDNSITENYNYKKVDLGFIQANCNVISFHVPYNSTTHHYISQSFIAKCKQQPIIINTARGKIADTLTVIDALNKNLIRGFGVDVFEDEPITANKIHTFETYQTLLAFPNVVATSHIAGWTTASYYKLVKVLWEKMKNHL
ncbi:MAG: hydroxyacid dehydrogenase [Chitinophagales bacterium]|nr:hydroxyacid dehydrogenase [Chitinophagales bacterium]